MDVSNPDWIDPNDGVKEPPEPNVGQPAWGTNPTLPSLDQELSVRVYDSDWSCRIYERVTGINLADNGLLLIQGNVILNDRDVNTAIAAYAPGAWLLYEIDGIEFRDATT